MPIDFNEIANKHKQECLKEKEATRQKSGYDPIDEQFQQYINSSPSNSLDKDVDLSGIFYAGDSSAENRAIDRAVSDLY